MLTRNQKKQHNNNNTTTLYEWKEPDKPWIRIQDLYPCIMKDPIQVYMKYYLHLNKSSSSSSFQPLPNENHSFFSKYKSQLYFVSQHLQRPRSISILKEISLKKYRNNYYSVPIFNERRRWKMMIDLVVTASFLNPFLTTKLEEDGMDKLYIVMLCTTKTLTRYKEYQAYFASLILSCYKNDICIDKVYFLNTETSHIIQVDIDPNSLIIQEIPKYCKWIRTCMNFGQTFELMPPSNPNLYPNMKVSCNDTSMDRWKTEYAKELKEITLLWKCHPKQRENIHKHGIYSFEDPHLDIDHLGIPNNHDKFILEKMLELYHSKNANEHIYTPSDFTFVVDTRYELYVDFETLDSLIYWIGVGIYDNVTKTFRYQYFISSTFPNMETQEEVMSDFITLLESLHSNYTLYYWYAEKRFWTIATKSCHSAQVLNYDTSQWTDLCLYFMHTPIIIKDCFNFKLKVLAKAMKRFGMIEIVCPEECQSGHESIDLARQYFQYQDQQVLGILESYNHFDCKVMYEMISFLKTL